MKIIHSADIHLGSPKTALQIKDAFLSMCNYAEQNNIAVILLSGDVFETDNPSFDELNCFFDIVRKYEKIDFLYLRGNHDSSVIPSDIKNLYSFGDTWKKYSYDNVDVYGLELNPENSLTFYDTFSAEPDRFNIVMLHGEVSSSKGDSKVQISTLQDKNIDYLALGHIHKTQIEKSGYRMTYAYPGNIYPRGNDELGKKGFILVDTDKKTYDFLPLSKDSIEPVTVDISGIKSSFELAETIKKSVPLGATKIRVTLTGEKERELFDFENSVKNYLKESFSHVSIKDGSYPKLDIDEIKTELSIRGEFVRKVLSDGALDDCMKKEIISVGLNALEGREV